MMQKIIKTSKAPAPIGPYNQAVWAGNILFVSGQIPIDPETGEFKGETIQEQTRQVMENIKSILLEAGLEFHNVVKCSIFLAEMSDFQEVNMIYGEYFDHNYAPARETVAVKGLPKSARIEISCTALKE